MLIYLTSRTKKYKNHIFYDNNINNGGAKVPDAIRTRQENLVDILQDKKFLSIHELSQELDVSTLTIRRDLTSLETAGLVERVHGGARYKGEDQLRRDKNELSYFTRIDQQVFEKKAIAKAAISIIENDQVIFLDSSSTSLFFAKSIPNEMQLTIITYSAYLPVALADRPNLQVISTGGMFNPRSMCFFGVDAENALSKLHAHKAIFGAKGVTIEEGYTDAHMLEIQFKDRISKQIDHLIVLADYTKIGNVGLGSFADINRADVLITDDKADLKFLEKIKERGTTVIIASVDE